MAGLLKETKTIQPPLNVNIIFKGMLAALGLIICGGILLGVVYYLSPLSEASIPIAAGILYYLSVFTGSVLAARWAGYNGLVHGIGVALLLLLAGILLGHLVFSNTALVGGLLQKSIFSCLVGAGGGVLGVGLVK